MSRIGLHGRCCTAQLSTAFSGRMGPAPGLGIGGGLRSPQGTPQGSHRPLLGLGGCLGGWPQLADAALVQHPRAGLPQGSAHSALQQGPEHGPVLDHALVAQDLCVQALQHLLHQGAHQHAACTSMALWPWPNVVPLVQLLLAWLLLCISEVKAAGRPCVYYHYYYPAEGWVRRCLQAVCMGADDEHGLH